MAGKAKIQGFQKARIIVQVMEDSAPYGEKISNAVDLHKVFRSIWDVETLALLEQAYVVVFNRANQPVAWSLISQGGASGTVIDAKMVARFVLGTNGTAFAIAHNHPSGNLEPSRSDIELTKKLKEGMGFLDLPMLDHLILSGTNSSAYYSFADQGML